MAFGIPGAAMPGIAQSAIMSRVIHAGEMQPPGMRNSLGNPYGPTQAGASKITSNSFSAARPPQLANPLTHHHIPASIRLKIERQARGSFGGAGKSKSGWGAGGSSNGFGGGNSSGGGSSTGL